MIIDRSSPIPQYFQLQSWLVEQIEQGVFKPNDKIPTEEELIQMAGLARATIRQAIQNLVNMGYVVRKRRLGTFVLAQQADVNKQKIVGVLVHDIRSGYAPEFLRGVGDEAAKNNYSIILCNTDDIYAHAEFHANLVIDHGVAGAIFMPTGAPTEKNQLIVDKFRRKNIPIVLVDREIPDTNVDFITTDNFLGAYKMTQYLIRMGHTRIAITLSTLFSSERERLNGYRQALTDAGLSIDPAIIFTTHGRFTAKHYEEYARIMLADKDNYSAIFAGNDSIAYIILAIAEELNIAIPVDLSLVGYDDLPYSGSFQTALTTVHQPIYEMGQQSMNLLLSRINGMVSATKKIELTSYLVERGSVKSKH
jgi:DNA-binding LacI/PurR family transcriptional regulator